jgi:hypothetical protein
MRRIHCLQNMFSTNPHLFEYAAIIALITSQILPAPSGQIVEESNGAIETEATDTASTISAVSAGPRCFPPCRTGYMCRNGECISLCNPPCQPGWECGRDAECHPAMSIVRKEAESILSIQRVASRDLVVQGIVVRTNRPGSRVRIADSVFTFDREIFLNTPPESYRLLVDAPGRAPNSNSVDVRSGAIQELDVTLRPVQINLGPTIGPSLIRGDLTLTVNFDAGITILARHYIGLTIGYNAPFDPTPLSSTNTNDGIYPDTASSSFTDLSGGGITYGYCALHIQRPAITLMPKVSIGYWVLDHGIYYEETVRHGDTLTTHSLSRMERHTSEYGYFRPGVEIRMGNRMFGFRASLDAVIGSGFFVPSACIGFLVSFL